MREERGDLFEYPCDALVVPINWRTNRNGDAIMGAGVALAAKKRWPHLQRVLGDQIRRSPDAPHVPIYAMGDYWMVCLPTKHDWRDPSDVKLIEAGVTALIDQAGGFGWRTIVLPRLGCGLGQLDWEVQVRPLLADLLDDRFVVVNR